MYYRTEATYKQSKETHDLQQENICSTWTNQRLTPLAQENVGGSCEKEEDSTHTEASLMPKLEMAAHMENNQFC